MEGEWNCVWSGQIEGLCKSKACKPQENPKAQRHPASLIHNNYVLAFYVCG